MARRGTMRRETMEALTSGSQYAHLAPELRRLTDDARRLWGDPAARREVITAIVAGMDGRADLEAAVTRVDRAVVAGLEVLGVPRGPIRGSVQIVAAAGPQGQKQADCTLRLGGEHMRSLLGNPRGPDTTFKTWVHESLHARHPFSATYANEYRHHRGYEEGLVEGLARRFVVDMSGMDPLMDTYSYYVAAYTTLARALGIDVEGLWRRLWSQPAGAVRVVFADAADALQGAVTGRRLTDLQRGRLQALADTLFNSDRLWDEPNEHAMMRLWKAMIR